MKTLLIHIKELWLSEVSTVDLRGAAMASHRPLIDAFISIADGRIQHVGSMHDCPDRDAYDEIIDATGRLVLPTWVDSHTHLVWHQDRSGEYVMRIEGRSYEDIAASGGGILNSALRLGEATEDELYGQALRRLDEVIRMGTGAIEIKSGYGLTFKDELKIMAVIHRLKAVSPVPIKATFLGAHAIPAAYQHDRTAYIDLVIDQMLPELVDRGWIDYIDVFCDKGFFTIEETRRILTAGARYGIRGKIHANELANSGGVQVGVEMSALSVDHLECIGSDEIACLQSSNTYPVALPNCSFFLGIPYAPARQIIDAGLPLVLASDYNPGSAPSGRMPLLLSIACTKMKLLPQEALAAMTINAAAALELSHELGSLSPGKRASFILTKPVSGLPYLPYAFGSDHIEAVYIDGRMYDGM